MNRDITLALMTLLVLSACGREAPPVAVSPSISPIVVQASEPDTAGDDLLAQVTEWLNCP